MRAGETVDLTGDYLRHILELGEEGIPPISARIIERVGRRPATVSRNISRIRRLGLIDEADGRPLQLTGAGLRRATAVLRRHRLAEVLLVDVLGVPYAQAHREANHLQHAIGDHAERQLSERLGGPARSPYGMPLTGFGSLREDRLSDPRIRGDVLVSWITERVQDDAGLLEVLPVGAVATVERDAGDVLLRTTGGPVRISLAQASGIGVRPV